MNITPAACVLPAEYACGECMCAGDCIAGRILKNFNNCLENQVVQQKRTLIYAIKNYEGCSANFYPYHTTSAPELVKRRDNCLDLASNYQLSSAR
jgi:hypothetical protein